MRNIKIRHVLAIIIALWLLPVISGGIVFGQEPPEVEWIEGPTVVDLGNQAEVQLDDDYIFLDGQDTRKVREYFAEPVSHLEVGTIASKNEYLDWSIQFEYDPIGYVKDDESESLDPEALLDMIIEANDEQNKIRIERGFSPLHVTDVDSNNLVWAVSGEVGESQIVNYSTRLLGRNGYMAVTLIADPRTISASQVDLATILEQFSWRQGKSYSEFIPGDRVAEIGLTALVAGGAGAIAAKTGLLAKFWKPIAGGAVVLFAVLSRTFKSLRRAVQSALGNRPVSD